MVVRCPYLAALRPLARAALSLSVAALPLVAVAAVLSTLRPVPVVPRAVARSSCELVEVLARLARLLSSQVIPRPARLAPSRWRRAARLVVLAALLPLLLVRALRARAALLPLWLAHLLRLMARVALCLWLAVQVLRVAVFSCAVAPVSTAEVAMSRSLPPRAPSARALCH